MGRGRRERDGRKQRDGARAAGKEACKHDEPPHHRAQTLKLEPVRVRVYKLGDDCRLVSCVGAQICLAVLPKSRGSVAEATLTAAPDPCSPHTRSKMVLCAGKRAGGEDAERRQRMEAAGRISPATCSATGSNSVRSAR